MRLVLGIFLVALLAVAAVDAYATDYTVNIDGTTYAVGVTGGLVYSNQNVYNVTAAAYGAIAGDGIDDAPAFRAAVEAALAAGGGLVLIPPGEFTMGSLVALENGRLSGGAGVFVELRSGVSIVGSGSASVVKVADAIGNYTAIFAQSEDDTASTANRLEGVSLSNFTIDHNRTNIHSSPGPASSTNPRYSILEFWSRNFTVDGVTFKNFDGVVSVYGSNYPEYDSAGSFESTNFVVRNCLWLDSGGSTYDYDVSIVNIYADGIKVIDNSFFVYDKTKYGARTAIETHGPGGQIITGNYIKDHIAGINVTGRSMTDTDGVVVTGNVMYGCLRGIELFGGQYNTHTTGSAISGAIISGNIINIAPLFMATSYQRAAIFVDMADIDRLPFTCLDISGNSISYDAPDTVVVSQFSSGIALSMNASHGDERLAEHVTVKNNSIVGAYVAGIALYGNFTGLDIDGNYVYKPAAADFTINSGVGAGNRAAIRFEDGTTLESTDFYIRNNVFVEGGGNAEYGMYFAHDSGDTPFKVSGNILSGAWGTSSIGGTTNVIEYDNKVRTATADDATPDVYGVSTLLLPANAAPTAITQLDGGVYGQIVNVVGTSATNSATIADSGNFRLSAAWTATVDETLTLLCTSTGGTSWVELARSTN